MMQSGTKMSLMQSKEMSVHMSNSENPIYLRERKTSLSIEMDFSIIDKKKVKEIKKGMRALCREFDLNIIEPKSLRKPYRWAGPVGLHMKDIRHIDKGIANAARQSGVYRYYYDGILIYIGSSDMDGRIDGKRSMWKRRLDLKDCLTPTKDGRNKASSGKRRDILKAFYKGRSRFPKKDFNKITHEFLPCHPDMARGLEDEMLRDYKSKHGALPLLNRK